MIVKIVSGWILTLLLLTVIHNADAQGYCPVNLDGGILKGMEANPANYYGKMLACNGEVARMERGTKGLPYFLIRLDKGGEIWVSAQVTGGFEQVGAKLRILGFFEKASAGYKPKDLHKDAYHLVGIALMDLNSGDLMMQSGQEKIVQQWLDGKIPDPGKRKWEN